jgi:hypothetical protein
LVREDTPDTLREERDAAEEVVNDPPTPVLPDVVRVLRVVFPDTERVEEERDPKIPEDVTVSEEDIPTLPLTSRLKRGEVVPIPTLPEDVTTNDEEPLFTCKGDEAEDIPTPRFPDWTIKDDPGKDVPIPSLKLVLSQKNLETDEVILEAVSNNATPPALPDPDIPPEPTVQVTILFDASLHRASPVPEERLVKETLD